MASSTTPRPRKTLAVIGGGPIGLEVAVAARTLDWQVVLFEKGEVAAHVRSWGQARLFSPFSMNRSDAGASLLKASGHALPKDDAYITAEEYRTSYLLPMAQHAILRSVVRTGETVVAIARSGFIKKDLAPARAAAPFRLLVRTTEGVERVETADVVVDASGTYSRPNALGAGGMPCPGEAAASDRIARGLCDVLGRERMAFAGKRVLLVGGGHTAATSAIALATLAEAAPGTRVVWVTRAQRSPLFPARAADPLAERRALEEAANRIAGGGTPHVAWRGGLEVVEIAPEPDGSALRVRLAGAGGEADEVVDQILANVGFGPDNSIYKELQVHECYATLGPMKLSAAVLGAGSSDCVTQSTHGLDSLVNPEPGFFILGAKSYGRNPNFLLRVGIEQVRDLFRILTGDAALDVTTAPRAPATRGEDG
ncbi:MAG: NAD(P)-binding domain-containing protein [bacterium]